MRKGRRKTAAREAAIDAARRAEAGGDVGGGDVAVDALQGAAAGGEVSGLAAGDAEAAWQLARRIVEAVVFASDKPVSEAQLQASLPGSVKDKVRIVQVLSDLQAHYASRGVNLVRVAGKWAFRTAADLSFLLEKSVEEERRLSRAAMETLAIIAYHQPVTRAEIEEIRGVATSSGTLDILLETGWVRPRGRRRAPGRPLTYGTSESFLEHFGLDQVRDLPGLADLKGLGLLDANLPPGFTVPEPTDTAALMPDELPLESGEVGHDELPLEDEDESGLDVEAGSAPAGRGPGSER